MHLNQTVITFSDNEKYELQNIMGSFRVENRDAKPTSHYSQAKQDLHFKENIVNFIKSKKIDLQEKQRCIDRVREFLIEEKCIHQEQSSLKRSFGHDQVCSGLQNLRLKIIDIQKNHDIFELFVSFMEEMKELREEKIYQFEYKLSKATKLSRIQRETLALIAKKIVKVESLSKMNDVEDDIIGFFSKIIRYGIHQEFKELERISSSEIKNKCYKLLEYLQNNCIEIRQEFSPVKSLLKKLSTSIYDKFEIDKTLRELPENQRLTFEPICAQIFRLRDGASRSSLITTENNVVYMSHDMKKAQQLSLETLRHECEEYKKRHLLMDAELKRIKIILEKFSHLNNLFKEQSLYAQIEKELQLTGQQVKAYLERIYEHLKSFEQLSLGARKASFVERKDKEIQFLQQKLHYALQELDLVKLAKNATSMNQSFLISENSFLKNEGSETSRILHQYHQEMNSLNKQINGYHQQISQLQNELIQSEQKLQAKIKQNGEMEKQIENLLNLKKQDQLRESQISMSRQMLEEDNKRLQKEKTQLLGKIQQISIQNGKLEEKNKEIQTLKHLETQNSNLLEMINQLNKQLEGSKASQRDIRQSSKSISQVPSSEQEYKKLQIEFKKLKEENEQIKEERRLRLGVQAEMKRMFSEQKKSMNEVQQELISWQQKYEKLNMEYQKLKKQKFEGRLWESERRIVTGSSKTIDTSTQLLLQKSNIKRMQEKHHLLQKNFQEVKKYNDLIKAEYQKLKQQTNAIIKSKVSEVVKEYKQNEEKMKQEILHLSAINEQLSSKVHILQQQNLNIKVQIGKSAKKEPQTEPKQRQYLMQSLNLENHQRQGTRQQFQSELRQLRIKSEQEKSRLQKQLKSKEETISLQRIQILRLQQKLNQQVQFLNFRMPERKVSPTDQLLSSSRNTKYLEDKIRRKSEMKRQETS